MARDTCWWCGSYNKGARNDTKRTQETTTEPIRQGTDRTGKDRGTTAQETQSQGHRTQQEQHQEIKTQRWPGLNYHQDGNTKKGNTSVGITKKI